MLAQKVLVMKFARERARLSVDDERVYAIRATYSRITAWCAASAGLWPQQNGACPATKTAGIESGSSFANVRPMTTPVARS